jgi:hypothetical protein
MWLPDWTIFKVDFFKQNWWHLFSLLQILQSCEEKWKTFKRWILADCVESFKKDSTKQAQSANIHLWKVFIFLHIFAESASGKINVSKSFKWYLWWLTLVLGIFLKLFVWSGTSTWCDQSCTFVTNSLTTIKSILHVFVSWFLNTYFMKSLHFQKKIFFVKHSFYFPLAKRKNWPYSFYYYQLNYFVFNLIKIY